MCPHTIEWEGEIDVDPEPGLTVRQVAEMAAQEECDELAEDEGWRDGVCPLCLIRALDGEIDNLRAETEIARRESAEKMRARCVARCEELAEQESALSRAAEARGDQYDAAIRRDRAIARLQAAADLRRLPLDAPGGEQ